MSRDFGVYLILGSAVALELALTVVLSGGPRYAFACLSALTAIALVAFVTTVASRARKWLRSLF